MFNQWVVYRQKHLLIGCHRKDMLTYELALQLSETLAHLLPEASSRPARAPHPQRLASLLGTRQLELAVLDKGTASDIKTASDPFSPYGMVPLQQLAVMGEHMLVAHRDFTPHHAWLLANALDQSGVDLTSPDGVGSFDLHRGVTAYIDGVAMSELLPG
ncbi:MAG: hypothetical protein ABJ263_03860 [Tateyamaria sp.]|uniref:hypothetical protein n=1 Tax=Tateyamaria sp. TaxID=1929288 RepID=UPI003283EF1B